MKRIEWDAARGLFLQGQGLHRSRERRPTRKAIHATIEELGFVQVDAIQVIERAHHLILHSRYRGYQPRLLTRLLEEDRSLFEHWTHDAAVIPIRHLPMWGHRFQLWKERNHQRMVKRPGGRRGFAKVLASVRERIRDEGPLVSSDFDAPPDHPKGTFWNWKPAKMALEVLWRNGELAVTGRDQFKKRYDLFERVFPDHADGVAASEAEYLDWALPEALARLGTATPKELGSFWGGTSAATASAWTRKALAEGRIIPLEVGYPGGRSQQAVALPDVARRIARLRPAAQDLRLLCPFDPTLRDRVRAARLFDFEYRFEGFVPAAKRKDGYYVMAVLEGDRFVARFDPRLDRKQSRLEIQKLRWERGARTSARRAALRDALREFADDLGAEHLQLPRNG